MRQGEFCRGLVVHGSLGAASTSRFSPLLNGRGPYYCRAQAAGRVGTRAAGPHPAGAGGLGMSIL